MKGKICFIADASSPHTQKWIAGCKPLNWEVTVISHRPGAIPGAEVIVHPLTLTGFPKYCYSVRRLIRRLQPDVVHAHQFGAHGLYGWFSGVSPLVISAWGSDILIQPKRSLLFRWLVKFLIRRAELMTAVSNQISQELLNLGAKPERIIKFSFGIPRGQYERLADCSKEAGRFIICSPRLHEPLYNILVIIKAFQQIAGDYPMVELWLLGDGSLTMQLREYVQENRLEGQLRFWGRLSAEEAAERIAGSNVIVSIPSSDGTPVSMLEGMAAGCLPVLSDLPVYHDWVDDGVNGLIATPGLTNLAALLRRSIEDQSLRDQAAVMNRKLIRERAIWEDQFQPMLEYYRRKVNGG